MNANQSKDFLNLDIFFYYDCNFGYFLAIFWVLNVFELYLAIKLPHAGLKGAQDALFHQLLRLHVNFENIQEVRKFLDFL
jgi:hypothetical protein